MKEMEDKKPWYQSKTIITLVFALIIEILAITSNIILPEGLAESLGNLDWTRPLNAILAAMAIIFRVISVKKIKGIFTKNENR